MKRSTLLSYVLALTILGLADAWYLADTALTGSSLACSIEGLSGCNVVAQSPYSHFLGIPLGVYGVAFYGVFLLVAIAALRRPSRGFTRMLALLASIGAFASVVYLFIQLAVMTAICVYCLGSAVVAFLLCVPVYLVIRQQNKALESPAAV